MQYIVLLEPNCSSQNILEQGTLFYVCAADNAIKFISRSSVCVSTLSFQWTMWRVGRDLECRCPCAFHAHNLANVCAHCFALLGNSCEAHFSCQITNIHNRCHVINKFYSVSKLRTKSVKLSFHLRFVNILDCTQTHLMRSSTQGWESSDCRELSAQAEISFNNMFSGDDHNPDRVFSSKKLFLWNSPDAGQRLWTKTIQALLHHVQLIHSQQSLAYGNERSRGQSGSFCNVNWSARLRTRVSCRCAKPTTEQHKWEWHARASTWVAGQTVQWSCPNLNMNVHACKNRERKTGFLSAADNGSLSTS